MKHKTSIRYLFLDIGGVLLSDGWDRRAIFVQIAEGLGIRSILHTDYGTTRAKLVSLGLGSDLGRDELLKLASTRGA